MKTEFNKKIASRANCVMEAANNMAADNHSVLNHLEEMNLHVHGYAEPGYSPGECGIVATGNWNRTSGGESDLPERVGNIFEKMGIKCEWSDEWATCDDCNKLIRTSADSYGWSPSYWIGDGFIICHECVKEDPEEYLKSHEDTADVIATLGIDLSEHQYVRLSLQSFETGLHPGQIDRPAPIAKELRDKGVSRFLFRIDEVSQFYSEWSLWVHEDDMEWYEDKYGCALTYPLNEKEQTSS